MPDDAVHRGPPTPGELTAAFNRFHASKAVPTVRPKFDLRAAEEVLAARLVTRDAAADEFMRRANVCSAAETAAATATEAAEAFAGLEHQIAARYAELIEAGAALVLPPELKARSAEAHEAELHRVAVRAAELRIQNETATARVALKADEDAAAAAAIAVIRCEGEAVAERCAELRREFIEARNTLMNIGAARLGEHQVQCSPLWLNECRDPVPEAAPDGPGVQRWIARARNLVGRA